MAGFVDVLLRGSLQALTAAGAGGVAWLLLVLRVRPRAAPGRAARASLTLVAAAAALAALVQMAVAAVAIVDLRGRLGPVEIRLLAEAAFVRAAALRCTLAAALAALAWWLGRGARAPVGWAALALLGGALPFSAALLSHAAARLERRFWLVALDGIHQLAVAVWVGGLMHLWLYGHGGREADAAAGRLVARRASRLAAGAVGVVVVTGLVLGSTYVGPTSNVVGTAYGLMVLTKLVLLVLALGVALLNLRLVRCGRTPAGAPALRRLVEVELGIVLTVLLSAAALTSLPPAVDVPAAERARPDEVAARFRLATPRLASPPVEELLRTAEPLMRSTGARTPVERAWSESNHHWAGLLVLLMGVLALTERAGVAAARHWPLLFLGLAGFLAVRSDPRAWPLGEAGFWESLSLPDVLQHRLFMVLVVTFGAFEWAVRTGRLRGARWHAVFPLLAAAGGGLLLTHSHAMVSLKEEFLVEVTHTPLGVLSVLAGWARWYEVRGVGSSAPAAWLWRACLVAVGALLLTYREG